MKTLPFPRWLYCALFPALILWVNNVHAAPVVLADQPLGTQAKVPPNIVMIADDSGSMRSNYTPDDINEINRACLDGGSLNTQKTVSTYTGNVIVRGRCLMTSGDSGTNSATVLTESMCQNQQPPMLAAEFNGLAYNPLNDYSPPPGFPSFNTQTSWGNVFWNTTLWTQTDGRPAPVNLNAWTCTYTRQQYNDLVNYYMYNATGWQTLFTPNNGNPSTATSFTVRPHYYRTGLRWCNSERGTYTGALAAFSYSANPGSNFSNCQTERFQTYNRPYFYSPLGEHTGRTDNMASPAFDLVVLNPVNVTVSVVMNGATSTNLASIGHPYYDESAGAINYKVRTAHEEITNYANWAAYYRNRTAATKTAAALAFNDVINSTPPPPVIPKVTFTTIQYTGGTSPDLPVPADYSSAFLNRIYSYTANFSTPLRTALRAVGEKFKTNSGGNYIKYACQRSAVIMFTDGLWNDSWTGVGNIDGSTIGNLPDYGDWGPDGKRDKSKWANFKTVYGGGSLGGDSGASTNWPNPIRDHKSASNTLADIALYYWKTRLGGFITNEVVPTNRDPAVWPHLNFYGMGFGVKGTLPSNDQAATLANMKDGTGGSFVWPAPAGNFTTTVDDLWHASINGFGRYVAATSPDEFRAGLKSILAEILNLGGANSGVGFTRTDLTVGAQYTYTPSFSPGWGGDIVKKSIDNLGQEHSIIGQKSAADSLAELLTPTPPPPPGVLPWRDRRQVFTTVWSGGKIGSGLATPVPFAASGAFGGSSQIATLGTTAAMRANAIAYLRGDRSNEGDGLGKFRIRGTGPLGDIVDAAPVAVTTPFCDAAGIKCSYDESLNPGYQQFYQDKKNRDPMVYVAANDGMLHAFDGNLKEQWAYIPSDLFRPHNKAGIVNLTFQESNPDTPFYHYHYVNATPRILDVFSSTDNKWKTVLVGGLGKGGTSYYALDVTDAGALALEDATASSKVKWEFTDDNMGYTYGRAILVKTRAESWGYKSDNDPDGKWVAILPSGYNNGSGNGQPKSGDGRGYLFFVDLDTGALLHKVSTPDGFGSGSEPLGIAYIGGYVEDYRNQLVTAIYAGDQQGNFWRFNLEDTDHNNWKAERMAIIKNGSSTPYVTTEPWVQLAKRDNHGDWERWVFVGTGGFRNDDDLTATIPLNTFYAFRDGTRGYADTFIDKLRNDLASVTGVNSVAAADKDNLDNNGWYEDVGVGYHLDVRPMAAYGRVVYAANKFVGGLPGGYVGPEPCSSAVFLGRVYARDIISTNTIFASGYVEFPEGVADITLVKKKKSGSDELAIAVTGKGGGGIDPNIPSLIGSDGEGVATGVPVITSIRYISD